MRRPEPTTRWHKYTVFISLMVLFLGVLAVEARPTVVLTTDFGLKNEAVGLCHGAILTINSDIAIVDLCHEIKPFDIRAAGRALRRTEVFPAGTVFVAVVDPGVGTAREPVAIKTRRGFYYIAPNNGLLTDIIDTQGIVAAYAIEPRRVNAKWVRGTFDGRDLFSPAGAILATNDGNLRSIGRPMDPRQIVRLPQLTTTVDIGGGSLSGHYIKRDDPYGNVWTEIRPEDLARIGCSQGDRLRVTGKGLDLELPWVLTFGDVADGEPLAYLNSDNTLAFALNQGDFSSRYRLEEGAELTIRRAVPATPPRRR